MNIKRYLSLIIVLLLMVPVFPETKIWRKFGTSWNFNNSIATTESGYTKNWNYYELTNYNSLISIEKIPSFTTLELHASVFDRVETPTELIIPFIIKDDPKDWLFKFYAFRVTGNLWGMNQASFIYSDRIDKTKPAKAKNNTFIKELASKKCKIKYDKMNYYRVEISGNDATLFVNNENILTVPLPEKPDKEQYIAISSKNARISIDKVVYKKDNKIILEDDFNEDSLLIKKIEAIREYTPKPGPDNNQKK